jgi:hypothetical protein
VNLDGSGAREEGVSSTMDTSLGLGAMKEGALEAETEGVEATGRDEMVVDLDTDMEVVSEMILGFPETVGTEVVDVDVVDVVDVVVVAMLIEAVGGVETFVVFVGGVGVGVGVDLEVDLVVAAVVSLFEILLYMVDVV